MRLIHTKICTVWTFEAHTNPFQLLNMHIKRIGKKGRKPHSPCSLNEQEYEEDEHKLDCHFPPRGSPPDSRNWWMENPRRCSSASTRCVTINPRSELPHPPTHTFFCVSFATTESPPAHTDTCIYTHTPTHPRTHTPSPSLGFHRDAPDDQSMWSDQRRGDESTWSGSALLPPSPTHV